MKRFLKFISVTFWGLLVWGIPFGIILAYTVFKWDKYLNPSAFTALSHIIFALIVCCFLAAYIKKVWKNWPIQGLMIGLFWALISIVLDMKFIIPDNNWTFQQYLILYGYRYALIPIIGLTMGIAAQKK
jgi:hypothetical protein